jgi:hypothetical protein
VGRPGVEPGSPRLQRGAWTCSATAPQEARAGLEPASPGLQPGRCAALLPGRSSGRGIRTQLISEVRARRPTWLDDPGVKSRWRGLLRCRLSFPASPFPRSRRYRCPGDVSRSGSRAPTATRSDGGPARLTAHVRVLPSGAGASGVPCEDSNLAHCRPGRASRSRRRWPGHLMNDRGRPSDRPRPDCRV